MPTLLFICKKLYRKCSWRAAHTLSGILSFLEYHRRHVQENMLPKSSLIIGGATTAFSLTFSSLDIYFQYYQHRTLICGQRLRLRDTSIIVSHLLVRFLLFNCIFYLYSLTAYKTSYLATVDVLGKVFLLLWWWWWW